MGKVFATIQARLVGLLLLVLVPILISQAYFSYDRYQFRIGIESSANVELARATAKAFDTFVQDILHQEMAIGLSFASSQTLSDEDRSRILKENQVGNATVSNFLWHNPDGIVTAATGKFIGMDMSDRGYFREIVAGKDWAVSDLLLSKATQQPLFTICRGIRNDQGELVGIIVAAILPSKLDRVLAVERIGDAGVSLLDSKGMNVYRSPAVQYTWEQRNWLKFYPILEQAFRGKEVVTNLTSERTGINRMTAFVPIPSIGWIASCSRAQNEVVRPIISTTLQEIGLILLVAFASLLIAVVLARTISSSVKTLRNYAFNLGQGKAQNPLTISGPAEIRDLADALNKMAEEISFREKALRESEHREQERAAELAIVLDAVPIPIFIAHDPDCQHISGNLAADELLKNPRGAETSLSAPVGVRPRHFKAVKDGRELHIDELPALRAARGVSVRDFEFDLVFEDGTIRNVSGYGFPLLGNGGRPRGAVNALVDMTERKKIEEALRRSEEQLKAMNLELERKVEERTRELQETQLQYLHAEKLSAIGKLSASFAHEFNSPLQSIMTVLQSIKKTAVLEGEDKKLLDLAIGESSRMKNLIRCLQDFNRPSSDRKVLMDIHQCLESILLLLKIDLKRKKISTALNFAKRLPQILAVQDQIKQVFLNLLSNASDACQEHGQLITISTWQVKQSIAVAIKDNGVGIEPEKMDQIFQPFYSTKPVVKGTGLGLSICHGIVQNHHGEIRVTSQPGEGSTFTVLLPINGG